MSDLVPYKPSKEELTLWFMTQGEWDALPVEVRRQVGIKSTSAQRFCHMTELMHEVDPENWEPQVYRPSPVQQPEEFEYPITNDIAYQHVPVTRAPIPVSGDGVTTLSPTQVCATTSSAVIFVTLTVACSSNSMAPNAESLSWPLSLHTRAQSTSSVIHQTWP